MPTITAILLISALSGPDDAPAGTRRDLVGATLFVPEGFRPGDGRVDVLMHLHGAASVVEPAFVRAGWPGVLIEFNRAGLSSVYAGPFGDPSLFPGLIDRAMAALRDAGLAADPRPGRVVVSSFSAGFGGLRAILKDPAQAERIDAAILADSLYCGYAGDPADRRVDPALMEPFRRLADRAASGARALVLTHSALVPEGYASTAETADDLIDRTKARPVAEPVAWGADWTPTRRAAVGRFEALGFAGEGPEDHLRHLRQIDRIWAEARRVIDGR